jgi:hypothetical protein
VSDIWAFIQCIPVLLELIKSIRKGIDEAKTEKTVKDHVTQIKKAFDEKDPTQLDAIFNK